MTATLNIDIIIIIIIIIISSSSFCLLFYMGVQLDLSQRGRNTG